MGGAAVKPQAQGSTRTHASLPPARGLTRDVKASSRPPPPAPSPPPNSLPHVWGGSATPPLPSSSLHCSLPSQSVRPSALSMGGLAASPLICFLNCHCARLSACCWLSGFLWVRSAVHLAVSLSAGLPLCFPMKSICLSFRWSDWLPITQATCSLSSQPLSVSVYPDCSGWLPMCCSVCPCVFLWQLVSPAFLFVCLSIHPVIPHPHSSPGVELGSLITKDHTSLPSPGLAPWSRAGDQRAQGTLRPSSPGLHAMTQPLFPPAPVHTP